MENKVGQVAPPGWREVHRSIHNGEIVQKFKPVQPEDRKVDTQTLPETPKNPVVQKNLKAARRDIKVAFAPDRRVKAVAMSDGMIQYGGPSYLREHYLNTGRTIMRMERQIAERRVR